MTVGTRGCFHPQAFPTDFQPDKVMPGLLLLVLTLLTSVRRNPLQPVEKNDACRCVARQYLVVPAEQGFAFVLQVFADAAPFRGPVLSVIADMV